MAGDPSDRLAAATQVIITDLEAPELDDDAAHHLRRVLRLRRGAMVCAVDGVGGWRNCRLEDDGTLTPLGPPAVEGVPGPAITVGFVPVKGDRPELVVQKLTELGVDRIVPFHSERSVVRWQGDRAARQLERLSRIARSACEQSRRLWIPTVGLGPAVADRAGVVPDLPTLLAHLDAERTVAGGTVAAERGGAPLVGCDPAPTTVLIGPEGGWAPGELEGLETVGLGDTVLRAETAAIAAGALLTARRSAELDA